MELGMGIAVIVALAFVVLWANERTKLEAAEDRIRSFRRETQGLEDRNELLLERIKTYEKIKNKECTELCRGCKNFVTFRTSEICGVRYLVEGICKLNNPCKDAEYTE